MPSIEQELQFVYDTQPQGGLSFKDEAFICRGTGYEGCIHIYRFPFQFSAYWLNVITSLPDTIVTVDTMTESEIDYGAQIKYSTDELAARVKDAAHQQDADVAGEELTTLRQLGLDVRQNGEVIKRVQARIFLHAATRVDLQKRVSEIVKKLDSDGYKSQVFLSEAKEEWQSLFLDAPTQKILRTHREGVEIPAEVMGIGFAHNVTSLRDPSASFYGLTRTRGTVYWDMFHKTKKRLYYNVFITGDMGGGKSTTIKKILRENAAKGNFIRGFDKSGEFLAVTGDLGGRTINLDGTGGRINLMQVFPTVTQSGEDNVAIDEAGSFRQHVSKLDMCYRILNKEADSNDLSQFDELVYDFYKEIGLWGDGQTHVTDLGAEAYPTLGQFMAFCEKRYAQETDVRFKGRIGDIAKQLKVLVLNYNDIFEGVTTIPDLSGQQVVFYDIGVLSQFDSRIFDIQVYNALTQIWGDMMRIGRPEKEAYDNHQKRWEDIVRFLIMVDECHNILNIQKAFAADFFVTLESEARKFFGGVVLATQRLERMFPKASGVSDPKMVQAANKLAEIFGLTQYKLIMKMDQSSMDLVRRLFGDQITENEYQLLPQFEKGDCLLSISGDQNLIFHVEVTQDELDLFKGGA
ncbi:ATPase [Sporolactobacillus shoreicorticis]|uniref:TraE, Type IV secretion system protein n=1 Tax=Sporolactobacillus shoreicorticis TaxID=1923877 RepID=A0ABW5S8K7_9BACL|nr:ATPase [Sporolactobacillus shoreicorticis]MCO7126168.1 ATPase [Sporolactobacillus shoreicorticis]